MSTDQPLAIQDECYRCGYDLRGIGDDRPCPECGLLAERSRRRTDELHDTRPGWLRSLAWGLKLILLSIVLSVASLILFQPFQDFVQDEMQARSFPPALLYFLDWFRTSAILFGFIFAAFCFLMGVVLLTRPERYVPADQADHRLRLLLRMSAAIPLAALLYRAISSANAWYHANSSIEELSPAMGWTLFGILMVGVVPLPMLLFLQLRGLALRARVARLALHCIGLGISASATFAIIMATIVVFENAEAWGLGEYWTGRSNIAMGLMAFGSCGAMVCLGWCLMLLIRFMSAFHRAARQLRAKWSRDDESVKA